MARMEWKLRGVAIVLGLLVVLGFITTNLFGFIYSDDASSSVVPIVANDAYSYGIIIDAGSTGSRLFLYRWISTSEKELIAIEPVLDEAGQPIVRKVSPGLSTFGDKPDEASDYIKPLIDYAYAYIPDDQKTSASFFLFATAGMRLLPQEKQDGIVKALRTGLKTRTNIEIIPEHIKVIDGAWEGIYNWIAVNYILRRFVPYSTGRIPNKRKNTVGMIDMGGGSMQIAFEVPRGSPYDGMDVTEVNLGAFDDSDDYKYNLFVTTFLGFGVNEGARKYEEFLTKNLEVSTNLTAPVPYVNDSCLPQSFYKLVTTGDGVQYVRKGSGDWDHCVRSLSTLVTESQKCPPTKQCYFNGVIAPTNVQLSRIELYGFSEYWYSVNDVLELGGPYNHSGVEDAARRFCSMPWNQIVANSKAKKYPNANSERLETQCFKSAWIHSILHDGFLVDENNHKFQSANKISDQEVQWALGAMIYNMRYYPRRLENVVVSQSPRIPLFVYFLIIICIIGLALHIVYNKGYLNRYRILTSPV